MYCVLKYEALGKFKVVAYSSACNFKVICKQFLYY